MRRGFFEWEQEKALRFFQLKAAIGMEGVMLEAWSDARLNHSFKNRTGQLEASIRIEKKRIKDGWTAYRIAAGVGGNRTRDGWKPYATGRPGGIRENTSMGEKTKPSRPYYAVFVELGTRKMSPRPFLLPVILKRMGDFDRVMKAAMIAKSLGG